MTLPPFVKSLAFWKAVSLIVAVLVAYFLPDHAITSAKLEALIYALLQLFNIDPELQARGLK